MEGELKKTIRTFMRAYGKTLHNKLGLTQDDIMNDVREQVWKGLVMHSNSKKANRHTYLCNIIENRFLTLYKKSTIPKHNAIQYYADVFSVKDIDTRYTETNMTGLSLIEIREEFMEKLMLLDPAERVVYRCLLVGEGFAEMEKATGLPRTQINKLIAAISQKTKSK